MNVLLTDLSSIAFPLWHSSGGQTDPDYLSQAIVARVRALAAGHDRIGVCCDSRRSLRREAHPSYKAQREARPESLYEQICKAKRTLEADGYAVLEADGYEADDVIAACCKQLAARDHDITIATGDKDLFQLVAENVAVLSLASNSRYRHEDVVAKFGVRPSQIRDWLSLVGDKSDNVTGCPGVGPVRATELLRRHKDLAGVFRAALSDASDEEIGVTPSIRKALRESVALCSTAYELIGLRDDAPVDASAILEEREQKSLVDTVDAADVSAEAEEETVETIDNTTGEVVATTDLGPEAPLAVVDPRGADWSLALEPRTPQQALAMAGRIFNSRLFSAYGNPDAVLAVILAGRSMGLDAMTALRGMHIIEGKVQLSAQLMVGLILRSGKAKFFRCVESTAEKAVYETQRVGDPGPTTMVYTIEEAKSAELVKPKSNWEKRPKTMLRHRCEAELARAVYPDIVGNCYLPDEMDEVRAARRAA